MLLSRTAELLQQKQKDGDFTSYALFVSRRGEEAFFHSAQVDGDTYFDIASMGKVLVTAPLILQAVGEKKLSLDDPLTRFFRHVPEEKRKITVKQLLTHTSGIVRHPISPEAAGRGAEAVAEEILKHPLAFPPGTGYLYSCSGMLLLGFLLERSYGLSLETLFETRLKGPLGYTRSRFNIAVDEPNAALCYRSEDVNGLPHPWDDENIRVLQTSAGSGGQFFTLSDLKKFSEAVMAKSGGLYPENYYALAEADYTGKCGEGRGLGWLYVDGRYPQTGRLFPAGSFGHCGHTGTSIFFDRAGRLYVILLTNATRALNRKNGFRGYAYGRVCQMREEIQNAVYEDFAAEKLL